MFACLLCRRGVRGDGGSQEKIEEFSLGAMGAYVDLCVCGFVRMWICAYEGLCVCVFGRMFLCVCVWTLYLP